MVINILHSLVKPAKYKKRLFIKILVNEEHFDPTMLNENGAILWV